jgi:peptidoglycan hydrolase-like protein with peptidoglycan-binding domain
MKSLRLLGSASVIAIISLAGCSTWNNMGHTEKGTTVGAASGAGAGAAVGGPAGAAVGGGAGAIAGHEIAKSDSTTTTTTNTNTANTANANTASSTASNVSPDNPSAYTNSTGSYANTAGGRGRVYANNMSNQEAANSANTAAMASASGNPSSASSASDATAEVRSVRAAQQALKDKGYNVGPIDNIWGPRTAGAVKKFQSDQGLQASGRLDTQTLAALGLSQSSAAVSSASTRGNQASTNATSSRIATAKMSQSTADTSAQASEPSFLRSVQQALNDKGYNAGTVDGVVGPNTTSAIRKFQTDSGLQATGKLDPATTAALGISRPYESSTTGSSDMSSSTNQASTAPTPGNQGFASNRTPNINTR